MTDHRIVITKDNCSTVKAVIFATGHCDPLLGKEDLEIYLQEFGIRGTVLIDYFLYNGSRKNRYICYNFNGLHLDISSSKILNSVEKPIKDIISDFYIRADGLDLSLLNEAQKFLLKKGVLV